MTYVDLDKNNCLGVGIVLVAGSAMVDPAKANAAHTNSPQDQKGVLGSGCTLYGRTHHGLPNCSHINHLTVSIPPLGYMARNIITP